MHANENHETLSINSTIKVNSRRNNELIRHDSNANGRLLIFDINTGLKHALNIIENYDDLRILVANRSSSICYRMLSAHDINSAHRLIEIFLKFDFKNECQNCLRLLFEYQCKLRLDI